MEEFAIEEIVVVLEKCDWVVPLEGERESYRERLRFGQIEFMCGSTDCDGDIGKLIRVKASQILLFLR